MTRSNNTEREQRILDAAANLFAHYGYDKTTVSDIARDAGVSQGAIYLHFDNKDGILEGLLIRELKRYAENWLERIEADPNGGTLAGLYKNSLYALSDNTFMSALFRQDRRIFGNYVRKPGNFFQRFQAGRTQSTRYEFVQMMQDAGAVRPDLDPKVIAHIMNSLSYGLVGMDDIIAEEDIPPVDNLIEGIADIMDRALTPEGGGNREVGKTIVRQIFEASRQQFEQMENSVQE